MNFLSETAFSRINNIVRHCFVCQGCTNPRFSVLCVTLRMFHQITEKGLQVIEILVNPCHFYGGGIQIRTGVWRFCRPLPYHLAMPPKKMERETGFEPATSTLARLHSTTELFPLSRSCLFIFLCQFCQQKRLNLQQPSESDKIINTRPNRKYERSQQKYVTNSLKINFKIGIMY
jgi:hypothetical protein